MEKLSQFRFKELGSFGLLNYTQRSVNEDILRE